MALTIRERRYWIRYLDFKRRNEQYHKTMSALNTGR